MTSIVPGGFEGYARILHPAEEPLTGNRLARWADVAAWSGMPLHADAQFHSIALPPRTPPGPPPYDSQGPAEGRLYLPDAEALTAILRAWTSTPGDCWFCVWDGYGWDSAQPRAALGIFTSADPATVEDPGDQAGANAEPAASAVPALVPEAVRNGPRVRLPYRDYLLYRGRVETAHDFSGIPDSGQTPNLWWPADRAWCVASEIDLAWTYVGGPAGLVAALLADERLETLPARPDDPVGRRVEDWVTAWVRELAGRLLADGEARLTVSRGEVRAWLRRPRGSADGQLRIETAGDGGRSSSMSCPSLRTRDERELRDEVAGYLTRAVLGLAGG